MRSFPANITFWAILSTRYYFSLQCLGLAQMNKRGTRRLDALIRVGGVMQATQGYSSQNSLPGPYILIFNLKIKSKVSVIWLLETTSTATFRWCINNPALLLNSPNCSWSDQTASYQCSPLLSLVYNYPLENRQTDPAELSFILSHPTEALLPLEKKKRIARMKSSEEVSSLWK